MMEQSLDPGATSVWAAADIKRIHLTSQQLTSFFRQHRRKQDILEALRPISPLEKNGMLAMVCAQLFKDKTVKHSKQGEINRVRPTVLREGLTDLPILGQVKKPGMDDMSQWM